MISKIQAWGNSQGIRINKQLLEQAHLVEGEPVELTVVEGKIIIEAVTHVRGKYTLDELVKKMPKNYEVNEESWGTSQGKEIW